MVVCGVVWVSVGELPTGCGGMSGFPRIGHVKVTIDDKGRVTLPRKLRDYYARKSGGEVVLYPNRQGLMGCTDEELDAIEAPWASNQIPVGDDVLAEKAFNKINEVFSRAVTCQIDKSGRIRIPPELRVDLKLKGQVVIMGWLRGFRIANVQSGETE